MVRLSSPFYFIHDVIVKVFGSIHNLLTHPGTAGGPIEVGAKMTVGGGGKDGNHVDGGDDGENTQTGM